jgi:hypothetical protein
MQEYYFRKECLRRIVLLNVSVLQSLIVGVFIIFLFLPQLSQAQNKVKGGNSLLNHQPLKIWDLNGISKVMRTVMPR